MKTIYFSSADNTSLKEIDKVQEGCWINIENATKSDLEELLPLTGLDYIDIDDSLDQYEIPRFEKQGDFLIVFLRNPSVGKEQQFTEILTVVLSEKYIITISPSKNSTISYLLEKKNLPTTQPTKMFIHILLNIAQQFTYEIKQVRNVVLQGKKPINDIDNSDFVVLSESEEILNQYLSSLIPLNNLIDTMSNSKHITFNEADKDLLEDAQITFRQSADVCKVNVNSIVSLRDSYQVIFTNNLNKFIKLLTSLTIILTVPTIIASIFGMNVRLPFDPDSAHSFLFIILLIVSVSGGVLLVFNWKRWL